MTKQEAYQEMLAGHKMCHEHYTDEEFVFINANGEFETEDGCTHGGVYDEFWSVYQKWEDGWYRYKNTNELAFGERNPYYDYVIENHHKYLDVYDYNIHGKPTTAQLKDAERTKSVQPKSQLNRNTLCLCGSGKKFKKCCLNK